MDAAHHRLRRAAAGGLEKIDWSESLKEMQRNWIGRSEGAEVNFPWRTPRAKPSRFLPRGPTPCSAPLTWCLAPEHALVQHIRQAEMSSPPRNNAPPSPPTRPKSPRQKRFGTDGNWRAKRPAFSPALSRSILSTGKDSHLDRRLRPGQLRHGRDHGRARPRHARFGVRPQV
jgi:hypothetical protein